MIQNTTGVGISLTNTRDVSLDQMNVTGSGDDGIHGVGVTNFTLNRSNINNNGNSTSDDGLQFGEASGIGRRRDRERVDPQQLDQRERAQRRAHPQHVGTPSQPDGHEQHVQRCQRRNRRQRVPVRGIRNVDHNASHITGSTFANNSPQRALEVQSHDTGDHLGLRRVGKYVHQQRHPRQLHAGRLEQSRVLFRQQRHRRHADDRQHPAGGQRLLVVDSRPAAPSSARSRTTSSAIRPSLTPVAAAASPRRSRGRPMQRCSSTATRSARPTATRAASMWACAGRRIRRRRPRAEQPDRQRRHDHQQQRHPGNTANNFGAAIVVEADNQTDSDAKSPTVRADITGNTVPDVATRPVNGEFFNAHIIFFEYTSAGAHGIGQLVDTAPASANPTAQLTSTNTGTSSGAVPELT